MPASSEKKRKPPYSKIIILLVLTGIGVLFLQNNFRIFSYTKEAKSHHSSGGAGFGHGVSGDGQVSGKKAKEESERVFSTDSDLESGGQTQKESIPKRSFSPMAPGSPDSLFSLSLAPVTVRVQDRPEMRFSASLKLFFSGEQTQREILLHRKGLAVVVKKVFSQTPFENIIVDRMRPVLLLEMNNLIGRGSIKDLMITDLHPIH